MKKNILCVFVAALALAAQASWVTKRQARDVALAWAERNGAFGVQAAEIGALSTIKPFVDTNDVPLWFEVPLGDSCMIVSPVTELEPVIAVLEGVNATAELPEGHPMYTMLVKDMTDRLEKLELYDHPPQAPSLLSASPAAHSAPSDPVMAAWAKEGEAKWAKLLTNGGVHLLEAPTNGVADADMTLKIRVVDGFEQGGPLTHWNQGSAGGGYCYNYYTPGHVVCGCVATMMSAIIQYFAVTGCAPGRAGFPCQYNGEKYDAVTKGGAYDWTLFAAATNRAAYKTLTEAQRELLGRVAFDAGTTIGMMWAPGGSGAFTVRAAEVFRKYYGFKDARSVNGPKEDHYAKLIYNQCRAGAPVGLSITSAEAGGHAVVAVGYGEDADQIPRVRIFTGWGGAGDGWYALPNINTKSLPTQAGSYMFDVINCVITMIGYDTDETVPVVGMVSPPPAVLEIPGTVDKTTVVDEETGEETTSYVKRVIRTDDNGYFGTRVSPSHLDCRLLCGTKEATFEIGAKAVVPSDKYVVDRDDLWNALPDEILFSLLNCTTAYTLDKAIEYALAEHKPILRVSGSIRDEATTNLLNRIYALDDTNENDFTNRFVYFFSPFSPAGSDLPDGNPSFGVFFAEKTAQGGRWRYENGRLSYGYGFSNILRCTTNDYDEASTDEDAYAVYEYVTNAAYRASVGLVELGTFQTNSFPYSTEGMLDALEMVLDGGWTEYERQTHGISLTVTATAEAGTPDPAFGVHTGIFRNGQTVTATAPDTQVTNDEQTVVMAFGGWTLTNETTGAFQEGTGTTAEFDVTTNDVLVLTWQMTPLLVKIDVSDRDDEGVTEPGSGWYPYGEEVAFVATPNKEMNVVGFDQWMLLDNSEWPDYLGDRKSAVLTFPVLEPLRLQACYGGDPAEAAATTNFPVRVISVTTNMEELTDAALPSVNVLGLSEDRSVEMGGTIEPDVSLGMRVAATVFTNDMGDVWQVAGWAVQPDGADSAQAAASGTSSVAGYKLTGAAVLTWVWELTEKATCTLHVRSVTTNGVELADAALPSVRVAGLPDEKSVEMGGTIDLPIGSLELRVAATVFTNDMGEVWQCNGWTVLPDGADSAQAPTNGASDVAEFAFTGAAVLTWVWEPVESGETRRALEEPADVPVGTSGEASTPITITPNADGTLTLAVTVGNAVKGYWYAVVTDTDLAGDYETVLKHALAEDDGVLDLGEYIVDPADEERFFKVRIYEEDPDGE